MSLVLISENVSNWISGDICDKAKLLTRNSLNKIFTDYSRLESTIVKTLASS